MVKNRPPRNDRALAHAERRFIGEREGLEFLLRLRALAETSLQLSDCCRFVRFLIFGARIVPHQDQKHDEGGGALEPENDF